MGEGDDAVDVQAGDGGPVTTQSVFAGSYSVTAQDFLGSSLPAHDLPHFYLGDMRDFFVRNNLAVLSGFAPAAALSVQPEIPRCFPSRTRSYWA